AIEGKEAIKGNKTIEGKKAIKVEKCMGDTDQQNEFAGRQSGFQSGLSDDEISNLERLAFITGLSIPESIRGLARKKVIHNLVCRKEEMKDLVLKILKDPDQFRS
ncbi:MAG: hypothetical protein H5T85_04795, partial [Actinobacteria bacterium]|nr:hypothetical protein [Actinomycetota bacterium]